MRREPFICAALINTWSWLLLRNCNDMDTDEFFADCRSYAKAEMIIETLPQLLKDTLQEQMNVSGTRLYNDMNHAVLNDKTGFLQATMKWYAEGSAEERKVCWPSAPDFKFEDFQSPLGALSALFIRPDTINTTSTSRFMDLAPGALNVSRYHVISRESFPDGKRHQLANLRDWGLVGHWYATQGNARAELDTWPGRAGRALFASILDKYHCTYRLGCADNFYGTRPYKPEDYTGAIDAIVEHIGKATPFAIAFSNATPRPKMDWLMVV